ncbi:MAG: UDP-N-acetylmuramate dehydrogenase [Clostridia bacterium]|jgi:UDP-N-acetylmuramate dehydrogenase|nr:UDP-N-acetylmuramate dehydrogenase [Clostridia bacterium]MCI2000226.1 UDP-N-acetylmuramate dehydrogenase [Clostridia bacterium]MCI2014609.1 UDP-N-acetylmuramate dehydrogenase [Clostridia bacterium]
MNCHTSFRTGGQADIYISPDSIESLVNVIKTAKESNYKCTILGNGSNTLVKDGGIEGIVIQISDGLSEIYVSENEITAKSGALLSAVSAAAYENSLEGFEFASGIPGSFGGAVFMNAGAYGPEMKDVLKWVKVLDENLNIKTVLPEELKLSYRNSILQKNGWIVVEGCICLKKGIKSDIAAKMSELSRRRRDKQPLQYPSAGSTFKRPEGYFAAKLIEDCGLKGVQIGGAQVSEKHAGFIINKSGSATSRDILDLIELCRNTVKLKFNVELIPEVRIIGRD